MKTSLATTISLTAVLAAGGLTFAVNTRALTDTNAVDESVPALAIVATASESTNTTLPASSAAASTAQSTVASTVSAETSEYELAGIGVIVLQKDGENLKIMNVNPSAGFTYSSLQKSSDQVRVELLSATQKVEFRARLLDNRIITDVQAKNISIRNKDDDDDGENNDDDQKNQKNHEQNEKNKGQDDDD